MGWLSVRQPLPPQPPPRQSRTRASWALRNPIPDGDKFYRPLNLVEVGKEPPASNTNQEMFESLLFDASGRIAGAELRSKARNQFNKPKHESYVNKTLSPFGLKYADEMLSNGHTTIEDHKERIFIILKEQRNEV